MKWILAAAMLCCSVTAAVATRCPPNTYPSRYSFGIYVCKQLLRSACPRGMQPRIDDWGTPYCQGTSRRLKMLPYARRGD